MEEVIRVQSEMSRNSGDSRPIRDTGLQLSSTFQVPDDIKIPENPVIKRRFEVKTS